MGRELTQTAAPAGAEAERSPGQPDRRRKRFDFACGHAQGEERNTGILPAN